MSTRYPCGYGTELVDLDELRARYAGPMHAEYSRRLFAWIESCDGRIGIGSAWRPTPDPVSSASQQGHSFHQDQTFASGFVGIAAIDAVCPVPGAVHRAPTWSEVPAQGTELARSWGLHANVNGEPWHIQPIELDGWQSWVNAGRRDPAAGYPIPTDPTPPPTEDDDMILFYATDKNGTVWVGDTITRRPLGDWTSVLRAQQGGARCLDFATGKPVKAGTNPTELVDDIVELGAAV